MMQHPGATMPFDMTATGPQPKSANLSPLMKALAKASQGEPVNFCPYSCEDADLDDHGYCKHLIGFTNDSEKQAKAGEATFEPMVKLRGQRVVQVKRPRVPTGRVGDDGKPDFELGPPILEKVLPTDKLVRITCSCRVYRDEQSETKKAKA